MPDRRPEAEAKNPAGSTPAAGPVLVGVDVGGTFTDCVVLDAAHGGLRTAKVPSTPDDQSKGMVSAVESALESPEWSFDALVHGTTVATNAVLERKGASIALITTTGFRDILEMRRRDRPYLYGLRGTYRSLVPRERCFEVDERVTADGRVEREVDGSGIERIVDELRSDPPDAIVVSLMNAYVNPVNEQDVVARLKAEFPTVHVGAGTEVTREYREFERTSTAVASAYVQPRMTSYLTSLAQRVRDQGFNKDVWVIQSNGGQMALGVAAQHPINTVLSGPAAGVVAGRRIAQLAGFENSVTMDMGGTSLDVGVVNGGQIDMTPETSIEFGLPLRLPMIDIHTIGAGGGSIVSIDEEGLLAVGPRSAGAVPGPACYGRGGTEPTLTDANVVLGYVGGQRNLGSGNGVVIDRDKAVAALEASLRRLGGSAEYLAEAVRRVAVAKVAGSLRLVTVERGLHPRSFALVAFGGAGPLQVCDLLESVGFSVGLVPRFPGITSALGCLVSDVRHDFVRSVGTRLADTNLDDLVALIEEHATRGRELLVSEGLDPTSAEILVEADMSYEGQTHSATVPLDRHALTIDAVRDAFERVYIGRYSRTISNAELVIVALRTSIVALRSVDGVADTLRALGQTPQNGAGASSVDERRVWYDGGFSDWPVIERSTLAAGAHVVGPAIIEQEDSTTVLNPGFRADVDDYLSLVIRSDREAA